MSLRWRRDFIRTWLERDVPQLGPRIPAQTLRRLWTMLAPHQGGLLNAAALARSLAVDGKTVAAHLDLLVDLLLKLPGRREPWAIEVKRGLTPGIERGFRLACETVRPGRRLVVCGGAERFPLAEDVEAVPLVDLCEELSAS